MKRAKSQSVINRNLALLDQIREIKTDSDLMFGGNNAINT